MALEGIDRLVVNAGGIGQQMDIWICMHIIVLQICQDLHGFDIVFRLHGADQSQLHGWHLLLHVAIDINDLPGIFPDAEPRHLCDHTVIL